MANGKRAIVLLSLALLVLAVPGCTKRIPSNTDEFSAAKKMVVTFRDGETLTGKFAEGENITYVTFGRVYKAVIEELGPPDIVLTDAYVEHEYDAYEVQRERMEVSELKITDGTTRIVIPRYKIVSVEEVNFDTMGTARAVIFWGFTFLVTWGILNSRF